MPAQRVIKTTAQRILKVAAHIKSNNLERSTYINKKAGKQAG